ncbi:hypothetical protein LINPERPRIM_LOCUS38479 [Linum perenne]
MQRFSVLEMVAESWFHSLGKFPQKHDSGHNKAPLGVLASNVLSLMSKSKYPAFMGSPTSNLEIATVTDLQFNMLSFCLVVSCSSHHLHCPNCIFGLLTLHLYTNVPGSNAGLVQSLTILSQMTNTVQKKFKVSSTQLLYQKIINVSALLGSILA